MLEGISDKHEGGMSHREALQLLTAIVVIILLIQTGGLSMTFRSEETDE